MILVVNDDGVGAPGLRMLSAALRRHGNEPVLVVSPAVEQSGQGHAITISRGLVATPLREPGFFAFVVDGTPADCVKLALRVLCPVRPRLVVSGINDGPNVGRSLLYSGTVGAALEAAIEGLAAVAISRDRHPAPDLEAAADWCARLIKPLCGRRDLNGRVLNLNLPARPVSGWAPLRSIAHGRGGFDEGYRPRRSGGRLTWHLHGEWRPDAGGREDDAALLAAGHPVLTTLLPDLNDSQALDPRLQRRLEQLGLNGAPA